MSTIYGPLWLRIPSDNTYADFSSTPGESFTTGFVNSLRFYNTESFLMARRLSYTAWRLNQLERWLGLEPTTFYLHDRVTQEPYAIDTFPVGWTPVGDWYSPTNLSSLLILIDNQIRHGGPSGYGAHRRYIKEFVSQARAVMLDIVPMLWADPPDGPGFGGAVFGSKITAYDDSGSRVGFTLSGNTVFSALGGGGVRPNTPDDLNYSDSYYWDYTSSAIPPYPDHYLPAVRLPPDGDWNTGYFNRLKNRLGTTPNANDWPPDLQILSEQTLRHSYYGAVSNAGVFSTNAVLGTNTPGLPKFSHQISYTPDSIFVPPGNKTKLYPPDGTVTGVSAKSYWTNDRTTARYKAVSDIRGTTWTKTQYPLIVGHPFDLPTVASVIAHVDDFQWVRMGFESDIQGAPWNLTWWDWLSYQLGAVPETIQLVGSTTFTPSFVGTANHEGRIGIGYHFGDNDEFVARGLIPFLGSLVETFWTAVASNTGVGTVSFAVDVTDLLKAHQLSEALSLGINVDNVGSAVYAYQATAHIEFWAYFGSQHIKLLTV